MTTLTTISKFVDTFSIFLNSQLCPPHDVPIVIGNYNDFRMKFIYYNVEQLTRQNGIDWIFRIATHPNCVGVWDYSNVNISVWAKKNISAVHVPPVIPPHFLSTLRKYREEGQTYDIGFSGYHSPRRNHIMKCLGDIGYKINYVYEIYGEERDKELAKCKILLNIHAFPDYNVFENARCEPWLAIGVPIISENSLDNDPRCINVDYDQIVPQTIEFLRSM